MWRDTGSNVVDSGLKVFAYVMNINLRPGKGSLVAKVEDEAGVHDVLTLDPRNRFTYKFQFLRDR